MTDHSGISICLSTCSRLRSNICTELAGIGEEDLTVLAQSFMKHFPDRCKTFYVKAWSQRESLHISMKCVAAYHQADSTMEEITPLRLKHKAKPLPTYRQVVDYVKKHMTKLSIDDSKVMGLLKELEDFNMSVDAEANEKNYDSNTLFSRNACFGCRNFL